MITSMGDKIEGKWVRDLMEGEFNVEESGIRKRFYRGRYQSGKKMGEWTLSEMINGEERKL